MALRYLRKISPSVRDMFPQQIGFTSFRDMYLTQSREDAADVDRVAVTHVRDGLPVSTMRGFIGHGNVFSVREMDGIPVVKLQHNGAWVEVPYVPGYSWRDADLSDYVVSAPTSHLPKVPRWSQGRVPYKGHLYELVGGPWGEKGPLREGYGPSRLMVYGSTGNLAGSVDVQGCGRVGGKPSGLPERGRVEPEGLAVTELDRKPVLVLNFACGRSWDGSDSLVCYQYAYDLA